MIKLLSSLFRKNLRDNINLNIIFANLCLGLLFIGCGGGSSVGDSSQITKIGVFIDAPVYGLAYKTATKSGFTNEKGEYEYVDGETVEFKVGDLSLGTVKAESLITPYKMAGDTDINSPSIKAVNIAILLQSLNNDRNNESILDVRNIQNFKFQNIDLTSSTSDLTSRLTALMGSNKIGDPNNRTIIDTTIATNKMKEYILFARIEKADPLTSQQWYLDKLNLREITGEKINKTYIQIVDTGFDTTHEDLKDNYDAIRSWHVYKDTTDITPIDIRYNANYHGTRVAGIIGARGFNGIGVRGVAPYSKISGYNYMESYPDKNLMSIEVLEKAWLSGEGANDILVSNNSWGGGSYCEGAEEKILENGTKTLRDGKGRVYVFAAGNSRKIKNANLNANGSCLLNNPYVITVAAISADDKITDYSSWGSNILVSAYANGMAYGYDNDIYTTDGYYKDNYFTFSGTSASAPIVSGTIGLLLESCPSLTYRDVKYLIATTANKIDSSNSTWVKNSANLWHSIDYGYGVIDLPQMLSVCKNSYKNLPNEQEIYSNIFEIDANIPNGGSYVLDLNIPTSFSKVEWIGVDVKFTHDDTGEIEIFLTSPNNTKTTLIKELPSLEYSYTIDTRYSSNAYYDENPTGIWKLEIKDILNNNKIGKIQYAKLRIKGH